MIKITTLPNLSSNNGVCYEIKKRITMREEQYPIVIFWYQEEDSIHIDFAHPPGISDFEITNADEEFYEAMDNLYKLLIFAKSIGKVEDEKPISMLTFVSATTKNATPNRFSIEKCGENYMLHFNEFSTVQEGFTDIAVNEDSAQAKILGIAFETFEELYAKREDKHSYYVKK